MKTNRCGVTPTLQLQSLCIGLLISWVTSLVVPEVSSAQGDPQVVAVLGIETRDAGGSNVLNKELTELLDAQLSTKPGFSLVDRRELDKIISEYELSLSGLTSPITATKIGGLTGAKVFVSGRTFTSGDERFFIARIVGVETGRVFGATVSGPTYEPESKVIERLADSISATIQEQSSALVAPDTVAVDAFKQLRAQLAGRTLPTVTVQIAENHRGQLLIDPAAETELIGILNELGFTVLDPEVTKKGPDVAISGEALSEFATRNGRLISVRGRIEVKAVAMNDGHILASDRQTTVGVDLSEAIAAKTALAKGTREVAVRLIPKLLSSVQE